MATSPSTDLQDETRKMATIALFRVWMSDGAYYPVFAGDAEEAKREARAIATKSLANWMSAEDKRRATTIETVETK